MNTTLFQFLVIGLLLLQPMVIIMYLISTNRGCSAAIDNDADSRRGPFRADNSAPSSELRLQPTAQSEAPPCGEQAIHDTMVKFLSQYESKYMECLGPDGKIVPDKGCGLLGQIMYFTILRRLHRTINIQRDLSGNGARPFVTVQFGCLDGRANDPIYHSIVMPRNGQAAYSLANWHAVLVEPAFMQDLKKTYSHIVSSTDAQLSNMLFVEGAINSPDHIDNNGKCHFFKVLTESNDSTVSCGKHWATQISGLGERGLRNFFRERYDACVTDEMLDCWTPAGVLKEKGFPIVNSGGDKWCVDPMRRSEALARIDVFVMDVEGYDAIILRLLMEELCPELWPTFIIYEDKVVRHNSRKKTGVTYDADALIEYLETSGYYVMHASEDVIALRVGYSLKDFRHTARPNASMYGPVEWYHPQMQNYIPGMPPPPPLVTKTRKHRANE